MEWKTWNFTNVINCFCCYVIKLAGETQKSIVISHLKSTAYRNKISFKLWYWAVNARKYVRCARTFYLLLWWPMITGMDGTSVFPTCLSVEEEPGKETSTRKTDPTGDRTWAHWVRGNTVTLRPSLTYSTLPVHSITDSPHAWNQTLIKKLENILFCNLCSLHETVPECSQNKFKYPQLVSNTRSGRGMRCNEAPIL